MLCIDGHWCCWLVLENAKTLHHVWICWNPKQNNHSFVSEKNVNHCGLFQHLQARFLTCVAHVSIAVLVELLTEVETQHSLFHSWTFSLNLLKSDASFMAQRKDYKQLWIVCCSCIVGCPTVLTQAILQAMVKMLYFTPSRSRKRICTAPSTNRVAYATMCCYRGSTEWPLKYRRLVPDVRTFPHRQV